MLHAIVYFAKSLKVTQGRYRNSTIRYIAYEILLAFHSIYGSILYHFRDKARYWSKIAIFL